jgi:hypothetical protein
MIRPAVKETSRTVWVDSTLTGYELNKYSGKPSNESIYRVLLVSAKTENRKDTIRIGNFWPLIFQCTGTNTFVFSSP